MKKYDDQRTEIEQGIAERNAGAKQMQMVAAESGRVAEIAANADKYLARIDDKFRQKTALTRVDWQFLFFAVALQCARQYLITPFTERMNDKDAAKEVKGDKDEHSDRHHRYYHPSKDEIVNNPVPYDAIMGSKEKDLGVGGGYKHRAKTLGHDPILGYLFGTYNIMTSTATLNDFRTYHIKTGTTSNGLLRDAFVENASTILMFERGTSRVFHEIDGPEVLGLSLHKQVIHIQTDIDSKASLPIPVIPVFSMEISQTLAKYGFDAANVKTVSKQIAYASIINIIIAMLHYLCYNPSLDQSRALYEVRTRKILSYSNIIASASNVLAVAFMVFTGKKEDYKKNLKYLDVGGIILTIHRIISDYQFKQQIEKEFLEEEFYNLVMNDEYHF